MYIKRFAILLLMLVLTLSSCTPADMDDKDDCEYMLNEETGQICFIDDEFFYLDEGFYNTKLYSGKNKLSEKLMTELGMALHNKLVEYEIRDIYAYDNAVWVYVRKAYEKYQAIYRYSLETKEMEPFFEIDNLTSSIYYTWLVIDSKLIFASNAVDCSSNDSNEFFVSENYGLYYMEKDGEIISIDEKVISFGTSGENLYYVKEDVGEVYRFDFESNKTDRIGNIPGVNYLTKLYYTDDYLVLCKGMDSEEAELCLFDLLTGEKQSYKFESEVSDFICSDNFAYYTVSGKNKLYKMSLKDKSITEKGAEWLENFEENKLEKNEEYSFVAASDLDLYIVVKDDWLHIIGFNTIYRVNDEGIKKVVRY